MQVSDLKIGMYLNCDGPGSIPVYTDLRATNLLFNVAPGQEIGQIHDIQANASGNVIIFASNSITKAYPWYEDLMGEGITILKSIVNPISFWTDDTDEFGNWGVYGVVKFTDLQASVTDAQVQQQLAYIQATADNGASLTKSVKKVFNSTGDVLGSAIQGFLSGVTEGAGSWIAAAAVVYVLWYSFTHGQVKSKAFSYSHRK